MGSPTALSGICAPPCGRFPLEPDRDRVWILPLISSLHREWGWEGMVTLGRPCLLPQEREGWQGPLVLGVQVQAGRVTVFTFLPSTCQSECCFQWSRTASSWAPRGAAGALLGSEAARAELRHESRPLEVGPTYCTQQALGVDRSTGRRGERRL